MVFTCLQNFSLTQFILSEILVWEVQLQHIFIHVHLQKCRNWNGHIFQLVNYILMIFGQEVHTTKMNKCGKFQLNPVHGFWENGHNHLQPICIFLEIRDVGLSNFWREDALEGFLPSCKISSQPNLYFWKYWFRKFSCNTFFFHVQKCKNWNGHIFQLVS